MPTTIYVLVDPRSNLIRYIGRTMLNLVVRIRAHASEAASGRRSRRHDWIRELWAEGYGPSYMAIEEVPDEDGDGSAEERYHIALALRDGLDLLNGYEGGGRKAGESRRGTDNAELKVGSRIGADEMREFDELAEADCRSRGGQLAWLIKRYVKEEYPKLVARRQAFAAALPPG